MRTYSLRHLASLTAGIILLAGAFTTFPNYSSAYAETHAETVTIINQSGHVDSPKIFWDTNTANFTLKAKGDQIAPLHHTMNYLNKITTRYTQEYYYTVPADPRQKFLGNEGDQVFWSPNNIAPRSTQLWLGFGADTAIPMEQFRDQSFTLDLVDFSGPGRMDLFTSTIDPDFMLENPVNRMLSSHEVGLRSTWIKPGLHTHNHTTFTQPGRYTVTYRASARTKDGHLIASTPQTVQWQVGGANAALGLPETIPTRYNAAPSTTDNEDFQPVFTAQPAADTSDTAPKLTELQLNTGDASDTGTAVFYVNGYYLTEIPVTNGIAKWVELIGATDADLQVVFIPSADSSSPRWVSAPLSYAQGDLADSTEETGSFPAPQTDPTLPAFSQADRAVTDPTVTVALNANEESYTLAVTPAQTDLPLHVVGGFYRSLEDKYPSCEVDFISYPRDRDFTFSTEDCYDVNFFKLSIVPDSRTPVGAAYLEGTITENSGAQSHSTRLGAATGTDSPVPADPSLPEGGGTDSSAPDSGSSSAQPPANPEDTTAQPGTTPEPTTILHSESVTIADGHLDIGALLVNGKLVVAINDDSRQHSTSSVLRDPQAVTILVPAQAQAVRSRKIFGDASFNFLGDYGTSLHILGATQQAGRPWPGFSTEDFDYQTYPQGVNLELSSAQSPADAKWWGFTSAPLGGLGEMIFSADQPAVLANPTRTHMHLNWAFTSPGTYRLKVRAYVPQASAFRSAPDTELSSAETFITFQVGDTPTDTPTSAVPAENTEGTSIEGASSSKPEKISSVYTGLKENSAEGIPTNGNPAGGNLANSNLPQANPPANTTTGASLTAGTSLPNTGTQSTLLLPMAMLLLGAGTFVYGLTGNLQSNRKSYTISR